MGIFSNGSAQGVLRRLQRLRGFWEILSPSPEPRDHIATFRHLAQLYAAVRNAYAEKVGFIADFALKTKRMVEESAAQSGLGNLTKIVSFDLKTLKALRGETGPDEDAQRRRRSKKCATLKINDHP
jgi:type I restriction enzyme R subunit